MGSPKRVIDRFRGKGEKVIVRKSKIQGSGVFAGTAIAKGERVFRFSKKSITIRHRPGCHCKVCKRCIQVSKDKWLYPGYGSFGWTLNHSCNPSCGIQGSYIVALHGIRRGDEITIDYSTTNCDARWRMRCSCGCRNCRKTIRSVQYLQARLFEKYAGSMPKYVEKGYMKNRIGK
jgi:hypothetical protein